MSAAGTRYLVLFRTHGWGPFEQNMAAHLAARVGAGDFKILADETSGVLDTRPYDKIAHTVDFSSLELNVDVPHREMYLWYNGDFPLYQALVSHPRYDWYCMVEYDALFNFPFDAMIERLVADDIEMVGFRLAQAPPNIAAEARLYYRNSNSLLPSILLVSRRVAEYLYQVRLRSVAQFERNRDWGWPFCEAHFGAAICDRPDLRYADLGSFGSVARYEFWPPHLYDPELVTEQPSFLHPVLDPPRFAVQRVRHGAAEFFTPDSPLRRDLERVSPSLAIPALRNCFEKRQEYDNLRQLDDFIRAGGFESGP